MRWVMHVVRMEYVRNAYNFWSENLKGRDHVEDLGVGKGKVSLYFTRYDAMKTYSLLN
jgi:hypothetical protein